MKEVLSNLYKFILCAESLYESNDKKQFVINSLTTGMTEEEKALLLPLLPALVDFTVSLMKSPKVLGRRYGCV
jgi:hypothetical protein